MTGVSDSAPAPYQQRHASTLFLRVPLADWARVVVGEKTEFRTRPKESSSLLRVYTPTPVVAYCANRGGEYSSKLMVLEERRYETLFDVSMNPESVEREGFASYDEFRRYWRKRRKGVYRPLERVHVWRVRKWGHDETGQLDDRTFAAAVLHHLYGEWL